VERSYEILMRIKSLAMHPVGSWAIRREEAIQLLEELQDATDKLSKLRAELRRLADEA
jgi:hypothetical protein